MTPDANDLCVFAVKRGMIKNRFDVTNQQYSRSTILGVAKTIALGSLTTEEPCYGTSATAVTRTNDSQPKYIRITDFNDYGIEPNHQYMTAESYLGKHFLKEGDVLFARSGATVGKTYYYDGSIGSAVFAGYCIRFRFDDSKVLPKFAYWCTKTETYSAWVKGIQRPSGQPNINKEEFKSFRIALVSIEKQLALVEKMDLAELKRIQSTQNADELLAEMSGYILSALRIAPIEFDSQLCCKVKMSDVISDKTFSAGYYHPERMAAISNMKEAYASCVRKMIDIVDFHRDIVSCSESSEKYLGLAGVESQTGELSGVVEEAAGQAFKYESGDILYGRLRPYLNKVLLAETSGICSTEFHVMRIKEGVNVLPGYLSAILRSDLILSQTKHMMTGNTHPRISNDDVKNLYIPVPELSVQRQIEEELNQRRLEARKLKQQAESDWADAKAQFEKELLGE